jgi:hypothetical protein
MHPAVRVLPGTFQPNWIRSCTMWLDPRRGFVANTTWTDQVQGAVFTYAASGGSTATAGTSINSHPTVNLTAGGGSFTSPATLGSIISASAGSKWSAVFVFRYTGAQSDAPDGYDNAGFIQDNQAYFWSACSATKFHVGQYNSTVFDHTTTITTATNYYCVAKYDAVKLYNSLNGGSFDAGVASEEPGTVAHTLVLGLGHNGVPFIGSLGDIAFYNAALAATELAQVQAWSHARWGI